MFMQESTIVILTGASCSFTSPALPASSTYRRQNAHARKHHYNTHWCFEFVFAVRQHPHAPFGHKVKQSSKLRRQWHVGTLLYAVAPRTRNPTQRSTGCVLVLVWSCCGTTGCTSKPWGSIFYGVFCCTGILSTRYWIGRGLPRGRRASPGPHLRDEHSARQQSPQI